MLSTSLDPAMFEALHRVLTQEKRQERRDDERFPFATQQLLATYVPGVLPTVDDFQPVQFCDLSPNGFSYLSSEQPPSQVLVALGVEPIRLFLASVMRVVQRNAPSGVVYEVGCRFVQRLTPPVKSPIR